MLPDLVCPNLPRTALSSSFEIHLCHLHTVHVSYRNRFRIACLTRISQYIHRCNYTHCHLKTIHQSIPAQRRCPSWVWFPDVSRLFSLERTTCCVSRTEYWQQRRVKTFTFLCFSWNRRSDQRSSQGFRSRIVHSTPQIQTYEDRRMSFLPLLCYSYVVGYHKKRLSDVEKLSWLNHKNTENCQQLLKME